MIRCHLFLIVFSATQLHLTCSKNGLSNLPLMRQPVMEAGAGRTNGTVFGTREKAYYGWRRSNQGNQVYKANQTRRGNMGTRYLSDFRTGGYETRQGRPIQQHFYNVYIHNSPNIKVHNVMPTKPTLNPLQPGITNMRAGTADHYEGDASVSGNSKMNASSYATTEMELDRNVKEGKQPELLLETSEKSPGKIDVVNSQFFGINETGKNPTAVTPLTLDAVNVSSHPELKRTRTFLKSADGASKTIGLPRETKEVTNGSVGNTWSVFQPSSASENKETVHQSGVNQKPELGYQIGNQSDRLGSPSNVMQLPSVNTKKNPPSESDQQQSRETRPVVSPDSNPAYVRKTVRNHPRQNTNYPSYGRHTYHDIMKNLNDIKAEKDGQERSSGE